jgi:hypothetical protein
MFYAYVYVYVYVYVCLSEIPLDQLLPEYLHRVLHQHGVWA